MLHFHFRFSIILAALAVSISAGRSHGVEAANAEVQAILKLVPANAPAAIIIPNLKRLSDQITHCMEGMDRANVLLGSRPIDQFKAVSGFSVGVNDASGMAIVLTEHVAQGDAQPQIAFIIPVSDADAFLQGNFASHEGDSYTLATGQTLKAKSLGNHVALAATAEALEKFKADGVDAKPFTANFGERGKSVIEGGEVFLVARGEALHQAIDVLKVHAASANLPMPMPLPVLENVGIVRDIDVAIVSLDFDPLGLIVRSFGNAKPESTLANATRELDGGSAALSRLPNKSFHFALAFDVAALGGSDRLQELLTAAGIAFVPQWVTQVQEVQFAAYPSPAGIAGGLFNDSVLTLRSDDPTFTKQSLRDWLSALQQGAVRREIKWEENKAVKDAGVADAYEMRTVDVPPERMMQQMFEQAMVGRNNWRGFLATTNDSVLMTFSQRPAVLAAAIQAAAADASALQNDPAIRTMRQWMPEKPVLQAYLGVGNLAQIAKQAAGAAGIGDTGPDIDASLPPIGFGLSIGNGEIAASTVIPAGVLAMLLDQAMQQAAARGPDKTDDEE